MIIIVFISRGINLTKLENNEMRNKMLFSRLEHFVLLFILLLLTPHACISETEKADLSYLNQKPPGITPEVFAPGIISTDAQEFSSSFSPDGKEFYFTRNQVIKYHTIMVSVKDSSGWTKPEPFAATKDLDAFEPCVSADGKRIYFVSSAQTEGQQMPSMDLWFVERTDSGWSEPVKPGAPFNPNKAMFASTTLEGTLYTTYGPEGPPTADIARSKLINGVFQDYEVLGPEINSPGMDAYPYIAPDESYLVFSSGSPDGTKGLYVSFRNPDGSWGKRKLINLESYKAGLPWISPDGKYLFFSANKDIYWVDSKVVFDLESEGK